MRVGPRVRPARKSKLVLAAAVSAAVVTPAVFAPTAARAAAVVTTATWTNPNGGTLLWNLGSNWSSDPDYPSGVGAGAIFTGPPSARTINFAESITVGSMSITDDTASVTTFGAGGGSVTFDTADDSPATVTVNGTGTGSVTLSAPSTLNDSLVFNVNQTTASATTGSLNWTGAASGTGGFTKTGAGMLTMNTATKTYTGPTIFDTNSGRTRFANAGRPTNTSSVTVKSGAQLELISTSASYLLGTDTSVPLNLNGFGAAFWGAIRPTRDITDEIQNNVVLQSDTGVHMQGTGPDGSTNPTKGFLSFSGVISGPGQLQLTGPGILSDNQIGRYVLTNANTYTGGTVINGGTLIVTNGQALGTGLLQVNANVSQFINTLVTMSAASPVSTGPLSGSVVAGSGGGTMTINLNSTDYRVNQTADGAYTGAISGSGGFGLTAASTNTLGLSGNLTYTGATTVAGGKLSLSTNLTASSGVAVSGGTLESAAGGGSLRVIHTPSLAVTGTGRLDIQDNKLMTQTPVGTASGGVYSDVSGMIQKGRNGGGWSGSGIVTSQSNATTGNFTSIGVATAQQVKGLANPTDTTVFAGRTVTGSDTLVMYTYGGDANLDGRINVDDYGRIDSSIPLGIAGWYNGDFNYDGKINVDDYGIIDSNIGIQGAQFPTAGSASGSSGVSAVPEPVSSALVALAATAAAMNRRRRRGGA